MRARSGLLAIALVGVLAATAPAAGAAEAAPGAPGAPPPAVRIRPLFVPVVNEGRIEKYNQLEITIELADPTKVGAAQAGLPRLQDAILSMIYDAVEQGWIVRGNIANATAFRQRVDTVIEDILGDDVVGRVLITPVARQSAWP